MFQNSPEFCTEVPEHQTTYISPLRAVAVASRMLLVCAMALIFAPPAKADVISEAIVSIKCTTEGSETVREGSGVFISESGRLLTARHVVLGSLKKSEFLDNRSKVECTGVKGNSRSLGGANLLVESISTDFDAAVLSFPNAGDHSVLNYCNIEERRFLGGQIIATGFPRDSQTGQPSSRAGIISTIFPDGRGFIETDVPTTIGMSGGMVTLAENDKLIGIVSGTEFEPATGQPKFFAVLAAQRLARDFRDFGLKLDPEGCPPRNPLSAIKGNKDGVLWESQDGDLALDVKMGEGFCFLVKVWGDMDHPMDSVEIKINADQEFVLSGENAGGGRHGALARCVNFE